MRWLCPGMGVNSQFMANKKYQKHGRVNQWILGYPSFELKPYQKTIRRKSRTFGITSSSMIYLLYSDVFLSGTSEFLKPRKTPLESCHWPFREAHPGSWDGIPPVN